VYAKKLYYAEGKKKLFWQISS